MTITRPAGLDFETHTANLHAFMAGTIEEFGLADPTYLQLRAQGVNLSLLNDMYPYNMDSVLKAFVKHGRAWFNRRNAWDRFIHQRALNRFGYAVIDLQRYMPSVWFSDMSFLNQGQRNARMLKKTLATMDMAHTLERIFNVRGSKLMNPYTQEMLSDMLAATALVAAGQSLEFAQERQVRKNSKATSNTGFDAALTEFFKAAHGLFKFPRTVTGTRS